MKILNFVFVVLFSVASVAAEEKGFSSIFDYPITSGRQRSSTYWYPLMGLGVPGLPQYLNHQTGAGLFYSIPATVGVGVGLAAAANASDKYESNDFEGMKDDAKVYTWGMQTYQTMGSLSTYHAFRSVVKQRQERDGDFKWLKTEEKTNDIMLAPFNVSFFLKPEVFAPLLLLAAIVVEERNETHPRVHDLAMGDGLFSTAVAYNAGTGEEALFRGYLMMNLRESWDSNFLSNLTTAGVFGAAHISNSNPVPWPQFLMGLYLGWMAQSNDWTLAEGVFLHTWWDIIAIGASMAEGVTNQVLWLPVLNLTY